LLSSREKISVRQAFILFILFTYSSSLRLFPAVAAKIGERAGWLTPIFAMLPFACLVYIIQALFKNDKEANLSDIIFKTLGKFFGTVLLTLYLIWMMVTVGIFVRYFAERFLSALLPNTPMNFFTVTILATVFYVLQGGIVYISRTAELLFLIFLAIFAVLFLFTIPSIEVINLFPVTHYDILPLIKSSYSCISIWGAFTFIFFFGDKINDKEHIKRFGMQSTVFLVVTTLMLLIQTIGVYGYSVIERVSMPYVFVVKSMSLLETIERIESVAVVSWLIVDFVAICLVLYVIVSIIKSLFSLSDEKSLLSPITIFAFIFSQYAAHNRFELEKFSSLISIPVSIIFGFVFPLIILIIGKIRKKI
jgi:spore germination protein KB